MPSQDRSPFTRCERGTITIIFALTFTVLTGLILAGLELARIQREAGQIGLALSAAAEEVARGVGRGVDGPVLAARARAAFEARMPTAPRLPSVDLQIAFDAPNRRVVARTMWDIDTAFGRRSYALAGDAPLRRAHRAQR